MAQTVAPRTQLVLLARHQVGRVDLLGLVAQQVDALVARPVVPGEAIEPLLGTPKGLERLAAAGQELVGLGASLEIEPLPLQIGRGQAELLALAVDAQQRVGDRRQQAQRRRLIVEEDAAAPVAGDLPPHHQLLLLLAIDAGFAQQAPPLLAGRREHPGHRQPVGAGAQLVDRGPGAGEQRQRVHHQALAGSGGARDHVEAGAELDAGLLDHRQIANVQMREHESSRPGAAASRRCGAAALRCFEDVAWTADLTAPKGSRDLAAAATRPYDRCPEPTPGPAAKPAPAPRRSP